MAEGLVSSVVAVRLGSAMTDPERLRLGSAENVDPDISYRSNSADFRPASTESRLCLHMRGHD